MDVVIIGCGGMGREALNYALDAIDDGWNANIIGWVDDNPQMQGQAVHDLPVLGGVDWLAERDVAAVIAVGSPRAKAAIDTRLPSQRWASIRHPSAYVGRRNVIGEGAIIAPFVLVTTDTTIGRHVFLNAACHVGHDARVDDYCTIMGTAKALGHVHLHQGVMVGAGADVLPSVAVGEFAMVGAGAVVSREVQAGITVAGVPARPLTPSLAAAAPPATR